MSEDLKPIATENTDNVEVQSANVSEVTANEPVGEDNVDLNSKGLKELVDFFQELLDGEDVQKLHKYAESIKAAFYKTLRKEKIAAGYQAPAAEVAGNDAAEAAPAEEAAAAPAEEAAAAEEAPEAVSVNPFAEIERGFKDLYNRYRTIRAEHTAEMEKQKEENYEKKMGLLEELKALLDKKDTLKDSFPVFRDIQAKWRAIGPVVQNKAKGLYESYQHQVEMFYDYVNLNNEFRDLDFRKNLEAKTELCEKAEALAEQENVVEAFRELQKLHEEWKELGPVSKEYREEIWDRFRAATSAVNKKHQAYYESLKGDQQSNLEAKTKLCEKVEAMLDLEIKDSNQWNKLTKEIEDIQKEWRTIGFASKKENQKIYDRFRAACDNFFTKKRLFYSEFKDQMQENMDKKIALCEQAEALKDSKEWKETSEKFMELQKQWKEIGPVSRKKSEQIWKRFRAACDEFFNNRDKEGGSQGSQYAANLAAKRALLEEVQAFELGEDREENFTALKEFQNRWNAIGFVPFKEKAKLQSAFKKALDEKFDAARAGGASEGRGYRGRFGDAASRAGRRILSERDKLVEAFKKKEQEIATWSNNMGFFSKTKNAEALLEELNKKIDIARQELADLENQIKEFDRQHEEDNE
jgi:hypothetical protein